MVAGVAAVVQQVRVWGSLLTRRLVAGQGGFQFVDTVAVSVD